MSTETPTKVQSVIRDVEELSHRLTGIEKEYSQLKVEAESHSAAVSSFLENINSQLEDIDKLELEHAYLKCLKTIEDLRCELQKKIKFMK